MPRRRRVVMPRDAPPVMDHAFITITATANTNICAIRVISTGMFAMPPEEAGMRERTRRWRQVYGRRERKPPSNANGVEPVVIAQYVNRATHR